MTEEEQKLKLIEYSARHEFWTSQAMSQLGYSINLFTTISIGLLTFFHNKGRGQLTINFNQKIDWGVTLDLTLLFLSFLAVMFGFIAVTSRLYDIRISRQITLTRKRVVEKLKKTLSEDTIDLSKHSIVKNYFTVVFTELHLIQSHETEEDSEMESKFNSFRLQSKLLGKMTWKAHKFQIIVLTIVFVLYLIVPILA